MKKKLINKSILKNVKYLEIKNKLNNRKNY